MNRIHIDLFQGELPAVRAVRVSESARRALVVHDPDTGPNLSAPLRWFIAAIKRAPPRDPSVDRFQATVVDLENRRVLERFWIPAGGFGEDSWPRFAQGADDTIVACNDAHVFRLQSGTRTVSRRTGGRLDCVSPRGDRVAEVRSRERDWSDAGGRGYTRDGDDLDEPFQYRWVDGIKIDRVFENDPATFRSRVPFRPHSVAWPAEDLLIVSDDDKHTLVAVDLATHAHRPIPGSTSLARAVGHGSRALIASHSLTYQGKTDHQRVLVANAATGATLGILEHPDIVRQVRLTLGGTVATLDLGGALRLWRVEAGETKLLMTRAFPSNTEFDVTDRIVEGRKVALLTVVLKGELVVGEIETG